MKAPKGTDYIFVMLISFVFFLIYYYPTTTNYYVVATDTKHHFYVNYNLHDPELFEGDPFIEVIGVRVNTFFYHYLMYALSFLLPYIHLTKWLPLILSTICSIFLFKLGKRIKNRFLGYCLVVIFLSYAHSLEVFQASVHRAFALPACIIYIYYSFREKRSLAFLGMILGLLIYPPIFSILLLTEILKYIWLKRSKMINLNHDVKNILPLLLLFVFLAIFLFSYSNNLNDEFYSYREAKNLIEFSDKGDVPFFYDDASFPRNLINQFNPLFIVKSLLDRKYYGSYSLIFHIQTKFSGLFTLILIIICIIFFLRNKNSKNNKILFILNRLLIASLILYLLSHLSFYFFNVGYMFWPASYTKFTLPLYLVIVGSIAFTDFILYKNKINKILIISICSIILFLLFIGSYEYNFDMDERECTDIELYNYISKLPKDVKLAGHPLQTSCIPLYGKRSVITQGMYFAFFKNFYSDVKNTTLATLLAYYGESEDEFEEYCKKYGVDYFIVKRMYYSKDYLNNPGGLYEPYDSFIKNISSNKKYYLADIEDKPVVYQDKKTYMIRCTK